MKLLGQWRVSRKGFAAVSAATGALAVIAIVGMIVISAGVGADRTFILEATATGMDIRFAGQNNDWYLGQATICTPRKRIERTIPRGTGVCDARRYAERRGDAQRINWSPGAEVKLSSPQPHTLVLELFGQEGWDDRTRVVIGKDEWATLGVLSFNGAARVGNQVSSGETRTVLSGTYEVREKPFWSDDTEVLKAGKVRRGESAEIMTAGEGERQSAEVFGHVTQVEPGKPGFNIGLVSATGPVSLQIGYFGGANPANIAPTWMDRALTSPLVLALAFLLSIILSAVQFVGGIVPAIFRLAPGTVEAPITEESVAQEPAAGR
ncbi:hypothetical protein [Aquamicrobium ahrensii]|uniref:MacB-like periplasmic core domain-containing protein n=1 Tax=Aquamicrobium ahrensii TaxID=469551 RepID=A0ABV2KMY3_9HYPH